MQPIATGTGITTELTQFVDKTPEFDYETKNHLWTVVGSWVVNPESIVKGGRDAILDHENLLALDGPGCWYCEKAYTPKLAARPCTGPV